MKSFCNEDAKLIIEKLKERVGGSISITVEAVEGIPRGKNGKFQYVISKVNNRYLKET